jgi:hypothetical protein
MQGVVGKVVGLHQLEVGVTFVLVFDLLCVV